MHIVTAASERCPTSAVTWTEGVIDYKLGKKGLRFKGDV